VLTEASASGAIDYLEGLKENVIIGRLIPTDPMRASIEVSDEDTLEDAVAAAPTADEAGAAVAL